MPRPAYQRTDYDCGIAALATLAGVGYERAAAALFFAGYPRQAAGERGTTTRMLAEAATFLGLAARGARLRVLRPRLREDGYPLDNPTTRVPRRSLVKDPRENGQWHWVVRTAAGRFWDPERGYLEPLPASFAPTSYLEFEPSDRRAT